MELIEGGIDYKIGGGIRFVIDNTVNDGLFRNSNGVIRGVDYWLNAVIATITVHKRALEQETDPIYISLDTFYAIIDKLDGHIILSVKWI